MSFHEKSALVMAVVMIMGAVLYAQFVARMSMAIGEVAPPVLPIIGVYIMVVVAISVAGHIAVAVSKPSEADDTKDERDRIIFDRAGSRSGLVLGLGVLGALFAYLWTYDGNLLFHLAFGALMLAQTVEYVWQIWFYRRGI